MVDALEPGRAAGTSGDGSRWRGSGGMAQKFHIFFGAFFGCDRHRFSRVGTERDGRSGSVTSFRETPWRGAGSKPMFILTVFLTFGY